MHGHLWRGNGAGNGTPHWLCYMAKLFPASQKHGSQRDKSPVRLFMVLAKAAIMLVQSLTKTAFTSHTPRKHSEHGQQVCFRR
jgi:hypothetical protein